MGGSGSFALPVAASGFGPSVGSWQCDGLGSSRVTNEEFSVAATKKMSLREATRRLQKLQGDVDVLELRLAAKQAELSEFRTKNADLLRLPRVTVPDPDLASKIERVTKRAITKEMLLPGGRGKVPSGRSGRIRRETSKV